MDSPCLCWGQSLDLVYDVQRAIQELQAECERLQEATRSLHEDNQQKQGHIEVGRADTWVLTSWTTDALLTADRLCTPGHIVHLETLSDGGCFHRSSTRRQRSCR